MNAARMRRAIGGAVVAAAATMAFTGVAGAKTMNIVAIGDSYTAGTGSGDTSDDLFCLRGHSAWGDIYAQDLRAFAGYTVSFVNKACMGSRVPDLAAQEAAITKETDLVLLSIGGNDVDYILMVINCFLTFVADPGRCKSQIDSATSRLPATGMAVTTALTRIAGKLRPGAKIGYVSYPDMAQDTGFKLGGTYNAAAGMQALEAAGDLVEQAAVAATNKAVGRDVVTWVPVKDLFKGHLTDPNPFTENPDRWVGESLFNTTNEVFYHPNAKGQRGMATAVERFGDFGVAR